MLKGALSLIAEMMKLLAAAVHWTKVVGRKSKANRFEGLHSPGSSLLRNIVYLHGFASSPRGRKVSALNEMLGPRGFRVVAPDLNIPSFERLDFRAMARVCVWEMRKHLPAAVVGSSLGALVALEVSRAVPLAPLVLVAPALGFGARWIEKLPAGESIPCFHHGQEKEIPVHRRFFEEMSRVEVDRDPPKVPVTVVMGRKDESVPFGLVADVWKGWERSGGLDPRSRFVEIPEGDHGLVAHVGEIAAEIQRICRP